MTFTKAIPFIVFANAWIFCIKLGNVNLAGVYKNPKVPVQSLPDPSSDWAHIRDNKLLYIDKTQYLKTFLESGSSQGFISRPRKFGKSIFLQMMRDFFLGREDRFRGLFISKYGNVHFIRRRMLYSGRNISSFWMKFPVIYLDFGKSASSFTHIEDFRQKFIEMLLNAAEENNVDFTSCRAKTIWVLIQLLYREKKMPVILLIDEFYKPVQDALMNDHKELANELREEFEAIFTHVKASRRDLYFTFMVGESKLPHSIYESGANNYVDHSHDIIFAQAFGFTKEEIKKNMNKHLEEFAKVEQFSSNNVKNSTHATTAQDLVFTKEEIREKKKYLKELSKAKHFISSDVKDPIDIIIDQLLDNYNGYCFYEEGCNESTSVLKPTSTIESLKNKKFGNYWYKKGSMKHTAKTFFEGLRWHVNDFKKGYLIQRSELIDREYNLFYFSLFPIYLYSFGYVTINKYDKEKDEITLTYPNEEVKGAVQDEVIRYVPFADDMIENCHVQNAKFKTAMNNGNFKTAIKLLQEYGFPTFQSPSVDGVTPQEITKRFSTILFSSNITFRENVTFNKDDNTKQHTRTIDFVTINLKINILISIKCSSEREDGTALNALNQLIGNYNDHSNDLMKIVQDLRVTTNDLYFMGIGFKLQFQEGAKLCEWIVLPFKNKSFDYTRIEAYPEALKNISKT